MLRGYKENASCIVFSQADKLEIIKMELTASVSLDFSRTKDNFFSFLVFMARVMHLWECMDDIGGRIMC